MDKRGVCPEENVVPPSNRFDKCARARCFPDCPPSCESCTNKTGNEGTAARRSELVSGMSEAVAKHLSSAKGK